MGKKINFPLRFLYGNFKIFSKISNLNWFFGQTRKILLQGFLISFRFIIIFQNSNKIALIFIKISRFVKIRYKFMKIFEMLLVSIDFWTNFFNIFASFWGLRPRTPDKSIFRKFSKIFPTFLRKFR